MREFSKSVRLNDVLYDIRGPVLDKAMQMEQNGEKIVKLNIGNPAPFGLLAPQPLIQEMVNGLKYSEGYTESKGILKARIAIADYYKNRGILEASPDLVYTGNGVSELIQLSMQALLNAGDEILVPSPNYPLWTASITLTGAKAVHYICDEQSEWLPDISDIASKITDKTKGIVLINPNNPTGAVYPKQLLLDIAKLAKQKQLIVFSDEIYDRLLMDDNVHYSIAALDNELFCVTFGGLSKSHNIAGFRIGWMLLSGETKHVKGYIEGINMLSSMRLCSNAPSQQLVQHALQDYDKPNPLMVPGGRIYEQRNFIYNALNEIPGVSAVKPKAAFYIFPKLDIKRFNIKNDEKFVYDFLKQKKILLVHGGGFHHKQPDHFRIVFLPCLSELEQATTALAEFLENYKQQD